MQKYIDSFEETAVPDYEKTSFDEKKEIDKRALELGTEAILEAMKA